MSEITSPELCLSTSVTVEAPVFELIERSASSVPKSTSPEQASTTVSHEETFGQLSCLHQESSIGVTSSSGRDVRDPAEYSFVNNDFEIVDAHSSIPSHEGLVPDDIDEAEKDSQARESDDFMVEQDLTNVVNPISAVDLNIGLRCGYDGRPYNLWKRESYLPLHHARQ